MNTYKKGLVLLTAALFLVGGLFVSRGTVFAVLGDEPTTGVATATSTNATLNGTNGASAALDSSFWVSTAPFAITGTDPVADGAFSTPLLGSVAASTPFSASLSQVVGLPAITPSTTYYFVAWSDVGGVWSHGSVESFATLPTTPTIDTHPTDPSTSTAFSFTFSDTQGGVSFLCRVDSDPFAPCTSPFAGNTTVGSREFDVKASDGVNESDVAAFAWTITVPPIWTVDASSTGGCVAVVDQTCHTIQEAVDAASAGDTINVVAGTYAENVTVGKALVINGAQAGVDARTRSATESIVDGGGLNSTFTVTADNVTLDGFTIKGAGTNGAGVIIEHKDHVYVFNNIITDNEIGVYPGGTSIEIEHNLFDSNNRPGPSGGAGIYTDFPTDGLMIDSNEFKGHLNNNPVIFAATAPSTHQNLTFSNNNVHDTYGIYVLGVANGNFSDNTLSITDNSTILGFGGGDSDISVTGNTFTDGARGIRIEDDGYGFGNNSNITIHNNSLLNNSEFGVKLVNGYIGNVDATNNWWGDVSGPKDIKTLSNTPDYNNPAGIGSPVTANVDYAPYFTDAGMTSPSSFNPSTLAATSVLFNDATLNGTNGPSDAADHTFWVSLSSFVPALPVPSGIYSTPLLHAISAGASFAPTLLSSLTANGVPSTLPPITPNTTYYYTAWSEVNGTWYPGTVEHFTTLKIDQAVTFGALADKTYGDPDFTVNASGGASGNPVTFTSSGTCTVTGNSVHIDGAGSCTITAHQAGNNDYYDAPDVSQPFTIHKANANITVTGYAVTYDANAHTATGQALDLSAAPLAGLDLSGTTHTNAGTYTGDSWTFTDVTGNYNDASGTVNDSIAQLILTITPDNQTKTYGDTFTFTGTEFTSGGTLGGDSISTVSITSPGAASGAGVAGSPYTITASNASGTGVANYDIHYNTGTLTVTQRDLTVSATNAGRTYDGTTGATVILSDDRAPGDALTLTDSYTLASFGDKNVGSGKTVSVSGISISGPSAANYNLLNTTASTTADITARDLRVTATGVNKVVNGNTDATVILSDDRISGDVLTDSYIAAAFADADLGIGKPVSVTGISISGTDAGNYNLLNTTAVTTADITKKPVKHSGGGSATFNPNSNANESAPGQVLGAEKFNFTLFMKQGSKGNEVMELQKFLNAAGYGPLVADGKFGPKTKAAVIKFQLANGLKGDGVVGPLTRAALNK